MSLASIRKFPASDRAAMRSTEAQDHALDPSGLVRRRRQLWIAAAALALLALVVGAWWLRGWATSDATVARERVRIAAVTRGPFVADLTAQATIVAAVSPTLYAPAPGTVDLAVKAGATVKAGDVLATLDSPALRNEYDRERATLDSLTLDLKRQEIDVRRRVLQSREASDLAGVQIKAAEREFQRADTAWQVKAISERDYRLAQDQLDAARLAHDHAIASGGLEKESLEFELQTRRVQRDRQKLVVADLERRVGELTVRSPVNGMVGSVAVNQKAAVQQDAPLVTVVDLSAFEIEFRIAESYADSIGIGMPAEINYSGKTYPGEVAALSPEVTQNEVRGRVRFSNAVPAGLRQNQRVAVRIVMDRRNDVLKVERGPFVEADGGQSAYVVRDDIAERVPIRVGAISVREVEILEGLKPGDQIVVSDTSDFEHAARVLLSD